MLTKVISGAQTGADIAGLIAAKHCGIQTEGWIPKGFKTETGTFPIFEELFGIKETPSDGYGQRTDWNARDSDGTLIISANWRSPGTVMTKKVCAAYGKPSLDVTFDKKSTPEALADRVIEWLQNEDIHVLNVAGNRESVAPGIKVWTTRLLIEVFHTILVEGQETIEDY
jgi:hypothetical protein